MSQFIFDSYLFNRDAREIAFSYAIIHQDRSYHLKEIISLPERSFADYSDELLESVLQATHIALGTSYWKVFCPSEIVLKSYTLTEPQAKYWNNVYTKGLGEFFYRNEIDFRNLISFPSNSNHSIQQSPRISTQSYLVGVGGGKDSAVTVEAFKKNNKDIEAFVVETGKPYEIIDQMIAITDVPSLKFRRMMDPQIIELNSHPDAHNGHIPISAIYAWLGILASVLYGFDGYIASNERSANIGNVEYLGMAVNHQWSKSLEFEMMTREYLENLSETPLHYVSLLRPLSEYAIGELFAQYPKYFPVFSSCNRNFSQSLVSEKKWCGLCPKCAFVFTILAAVLSEQEVLRIFGSNLFNVPSLEKTFRELLGLEGFKPFECVGTPEEMKYALMKIHEKGTFPDSLIMKIYSSEIMPTVDPEALESAIYLEDTKSLPPEFEHLI